MSRAGNVLIVDHHVKNIYASGGGGGGGERKVTLLFST